MSCSCLVTQDFQLVIYSGEPDAPNNRLLSVILKRLKVGSLSQNAFKKLLV